MMSLRSLRRMQAKKLADPEQIRRTRVKYRVFLQCGGQAAWIGIVDRHAETSGTLSNCLAYSSHTKNTENLSSELPPQQDWTRRCPCSCTHHLLAFVRPP